MSLPWDLPNYPALGGTPPYVNNGGGGTDWGKLLPWLTQTGAAIGSAALQARSQGQQNQQVQQRLDMLNQLAQSEQQRREYYTSLLLPNLLRGLGQHDPGVLSMASARLKSMPGYGGQVPQGAQQPQALGSPNVGQSGYQVMPYYNGGAGIGRNPLDPNEI